MSIGMTPGPLTCSICDSSHRDIGTMTLSYEWRVAESIPTASTSSMVIGNSNAGMSPRRHAATHTPAATTTAASSSMPANRYPPGASPRTALAQVMRGEVPRLEPVAPQTVAQTGQLRASAAQSRVPPPNNNNNSGSGVAVNSSFDNAVSDWQQARAQPSTSSASATTTTAPNTRPTIPLLNTASVPGYAGASTTTPSAAKTAPSVGEDDDDEAHNSWDDPDQAEF
jgi:hypothetical protein